MKKLTNKEVMEFMDFNPIDEKLLNQAAQRYKESFTDLINLLFLFEEKIIGCSKNDLLDSCLEISKIDDSNSIEDHLKILYHFSSLFLNAKQAGEKLREQLNKIKTANK